MKSLKDAFFLVLGLIFFGASFYWAWYQPAPARFQPKLQAIKADAYIKVGDQVIPVELAQTSAERELGLSGRNELERGQGLLFIFENSGKYGFWMKDMKFPIDIVWIDENWRVVNVEKEIRPETFPKVFSPKSPVRYVLELNSSDAMRLGIDTGTELFFSTEN